MPATYEDRINGLTTSVAVKAPCRAATSGPITLSGLQTVDGVALAAEDRVLVKDQANQADNGIYYAETTAWQRAPDFDGARDAVKGTLVKVNEGTLWAGSFWTVTTDDPVVFGTSPITFTQSNSALAGVSSFVENLLSAPDAATFRGDIGAAPSARIISAAGLATGGGDLSADRTITVTAASQAEAEAGVATTVAMNPQRTAQAIAALAPKGKSILALMSASTGPAAGTTTFLWTFGHASEGSAGRRGLPMPFACTVRNLRACVSDAPAGVQTYIYTVRKNGVDTAITSTTSGSALTSSDTTHNVAFAAGDELTVKLVTSATATANASHSITLELDAT